MIWLILLAAAVGYLTAIFIRLMALAAGADLLPLGRALVFTTSAIVCLYVTGVLPL